MLEVSGIKVNYGKSKVINGLSINIEEGEKLAILGRNGVGKTTLLKAVMGVLPLEDGHIALEGEDISKEMPHMRSKQGIAYVPQGREIIPDLTVEENLDLGGYAHTSDLSGQKNKVLDFFRRLMYTLKEKGECFLADSSSSWQLPARLWQALKSFCLMSRRRAFSLILLLK